MTVVRRIEGGSTSDNVRNVGTREKLLWEDVLNVVKCKQGEVED